MPFIGEGGKIYYKHIEDLNRLDMNSRTAAERVTVEWLKELVERRLRGADAPPIPIHLGRTSGNSVKAKFAEYPFQAFR